LYIKMWMGVHIRVYNYIYIYVYIPACTFFNTLVHVYIYIWMNEFLCACMYVLIYIYIQLENTLTSNYTVSNNKNKKFVWVFTWCESSNVKSLMSMQDLKLGD